MNRRLKHPPRPAAPRGSGLFTHQRRAGRVAVAALSTTLALLLQACGLLSGSPSASADPAPAAPSSTDAARASGKAPLLVSTRTGREAALAIEQAMDATDIFKLGNVLALTSSVAAQAWRNPHSGREFTVTPMRGFAGDQGMCREFSVDVSASAGIERMSGAACQGADQRWRVLR